MTIRIEILVTGALIITGAAGWLVKLLVGNVKDLTSAIQHYREVLAAILEDVKNMTNNNSYSHGLIDAKMNEHDSKLEAHKITLTEHEIKIKELQNKIK